MPTGDVALSERSPLQDNSLSSGEADPIPTRLYGQAGIRAAHGAERHVTRIVCPGLSSVHAALWEQSRGNCEQQGSAKTAWLSLMLVELPASMHRPPLLICQWSSVTAELAPAEDQVFGTMVRVQSVPYADFSLGTAPRTLPGSPGLSGSSIARQRYRSWICHR